MGAGHWLRKEIIEKSTTNTTPPLSKRSDELNEMLPEQKQPSLEQSPRVTERKSIIWVPIGKEPLTIAEYVLFQNELTERGNQKEMDQMTKRSGSEGTER